MRAILDFFRYGLPVLALLGGCQTVSRPAGQSGNVVTDDAARMIVVAVHNAPQAAPRTGSTRRAYSTGLYAITASAHDDLRSLAHDYRLQSVSEWPIAMLDMHCALFAIPDGADRDALLSRLQHDARVRLAQPLNVFETRTLPLADPYAAMQTGMQRMQLSAAHRQSQGQGVRVAVIDTGMDSMHPDLAGRVAGEFNMVDNNTAQFHRDRHGTAVAGVLAANKDNGVGVMGVAPQARLMSIKACWELGPRSDAARCNSFTLAQAIATAVAKDADIINLSITGPGDGLLSILLERAIARGMVVVGARSPADKPDFPANVPRVITATSDGAAQTTALRAPGHEVLTLAPGGRYDFASGDSLATAAISGVSALLLARQRNLRAEKLRQLLVSTLEPSADPAQPPVVNACRALAALTGVDNCAPSGVR